MFSLCVCVCECNPVSPACAFVNFNSPGEIWVFLTSPKDDWVWAHEYSFQPLGLNQTSASEPNKQRCTEWSEVTTRPNGRTRGMGLSAPWPNLHIRAVQTGGASWQISPDRLKHPPDRLKHPPVALSSVCPNSAKISAWKWNLLNVNNL